MPKAKPLENEYGKRYGRLVVLSFSHYRKYLSPTGRTRLRTYFQCRCDCGNKSAVNMDSLHSGSTSSCGCYAAEIKIKSNTTHGDGSRIIRVPEYSIWNDIRKRCYNQNCKSYRDYGAKGVTVCSRWRNSYPAFLEDMGRRPSPLYTIDRIDNSKGYGPDNCRWVTRLTQNRNKNNNFYIDYLGETKTLSEWAQLVGLKASTIRYRIKIAGWSVEKTFTTPCMGPGSNQTTYI